jgi:hypothetical protein
MGKKRVLVCYGLTLMQLPAGLVHTKAKTPAAISVEVSGTVFSLTANCH